MRFCAIEAVLPRKRVTNEDMIAAVRAASRDHLDARELRLLERGLSQLFQAAGTKVRYHRAEDETAHDLVVEAGEAALRSAGLARREVDLVIWVGVGRGLLEPATAAIFQHRLGLERATGFDLLEACASWARAVDVAHALLATRRYRTVMILNGEFNCREYGRFRFGSVRELDFLFPTFTIGEAATATILSASDEDDEYYASFRTFGAEHGLCMIPLPNAEQFLGDALDPNAEEFRFLSYGRELMRFCAERLVEQYEKDPEVQGFPYDVVFYHAASDAVAESVARACGLALDRVYFSHGRFGNTVSGTVPVAMAHALRERRLRHGSRVLVGIGSAGVSTAWCRFRFLNA